MDSVRRAALACATALALAGTAATAPIPKAARPTPESELARLKGTWKAVSWQVKGHALALSADLPERAIRFAADGSFEWINGNSSNGKIARVDPSRNPKEIDYGFTTGGYEGKTQKAIYKLEGDTFTECFADPGEARPTGFSSTAENGWGLIVYKRVRMAD